MAEEKDSIPIPMATAAAVPRSTLSPPEIEMQLHVINRQKLVKSLQQHLADSARPIQGIVLLQGGEEQNRYCTDHTELFRQESYFAYLFGVREPSFYGAVDVATGKSILFAPRLPAEYAVWLGKIKPLSHFTERYKVDMVCYVDMMEEVLHSLYKGEDKSLLFLLHGLNTDSGNFSKPADFEGIENFKTDLSTLHPILTECRVLKSKMELDIIQYANDISSEAHVEVMRNTNVGMKEYQMESLFLHHTYMYGGCRHCSYTCICATGDNSSVLHYGHAAAPNERTFMDGDMALLDMGAEYHFYGSDITCSFPVNGKFTVDQCLIYNAVLDAHNSVIAAMKPGVNWVNMHKLAEKVILEALKKGNIITGDIQDMMAQRLGAVFMPHARFTLFKIWENPCSTQQFLKQNSNSIHAFVSNAANGANADLIESLPNLEIIASYSVGFDKIDLGLCKKKEIKVTNTPDVLTDDVADLAIGLILSTLRRVCVADAFVRNGCWKDSDLPLSTKFTGKSVGILGLGRIGSAIAKRAGAFGCQVSYCSRSKKPDVQYKYYEKVVDLAANCEILVISCSLTEETRHIINRDVIDALGPKSILINIGRGAHVVEAELVSALLEGRLGGAGLDVFENEPNVPEELLKLDNVVMLSHVGSDTVETCKAMADLVIRNLEAHFQKEPLLTPVI